MNPSSTPKPQAQFQSHLEYYAEHGISPVHYDVSDLQAHLQRRASLYRSLRLPAAAFRGSRVLEVAAGTGQNSLYVASLRPASMLLVEPNAAGLAQIRQLYATTAIPHTAPEVLETTLERWQPTEHWDIVLCENWLGTSDHERGLLRKLSGFVAPGGALALTSVPPVGLVSNLVRRMLADRLVADVPAFAQRTEMLERAFAPHLATLPSMTRSVTDWVQDNMLNPAYFGLCLDIDTIVDELGPEFSALGTSPEFATDWRWFKSLHGDARAFNLRLVDAYRAACHNFIDQRFLGDAKAADGGRALEAAARALLAAAIGQASALQAGVADAAHAARQDATRAVRAIAAHADLLQPQTVEALLEGAALVESPSVPAVASVAGAARFGALFGRETLYLSFEKSGASS